MEKQENSPVFIKFAKTSILKNHRILKNIRFLEKSHEDIVRFSFPVVSIVANECELGVQIEETRLSMQARLRERPMTKW